MMQRVVRAVLLFAMFGHGSGLSALGVVWGDGIHAPPGNVPRSSTAFAPPQQISLTVFRLTANGGVTADKCTPGDSSFGCVHAAGQGTYPYATNPITISMENDYLLNVVPQEMPLSFEPIALEAQVVAARTYAYWHINRGSKINNSISYQAFVPGKFAAYGAQPDNLAEPCASLNLSAAQRKLCDAMRTPRYLSPAASDVPVLTEFSADWPDRTVGRASQPGLVAVDDPISNTSNGICTSSGAGSHGRGLSQTGAQRWARGTQCAYGTARAFWSVRWRTAEQLLFHYYTGVRLRDASGAPADLESRWNPLAIAGGERISPGVPNAMIVKVQNTSPAAWACDSAVISRTLGYRWVSNTQTIDGLGQAAVPCGLAPGDPSPSVSLVITDAPDWTPGPYSMTLDMRAHMTDSTLLWFSDEGWAPYTLTFQLSVPIRQVIWLPAVVRE